MTRDNIYNNFFDEEIWRLVLQENKDLLEDYILELKQNKKSPQTVYQYSVDLKGMLCYVYKHLGNKSVLELTKRDWRKYSLYLTEDCSLSNARHNRLLSSLRSWLNFCENEDDLEYTNNTARKVKGLPKESVREIIFLSDEQVMKLKDELIRRKEYQKATLLALAYDSCGRKGELAQVKKLSFLDPSKNNTNKVIGKRRKVFCLVYFSLTKSCAKLWLDQRGDDDVDSLWVIGEKGNYKPADSSNIYEWFMVMRKILTELEGKEIDFNVHSLRHSGLQNLSDGSSYLCKELGMEKGFPIEKLKLIANHSDISTTSGYLRDNSIEELAEMFNIKIEN
jgi:integrase/recombinase XerD